MSNVGSTFESQVLVQSPDLGSLGAIGLAGTIRNSPGVGFRPFRVLGSYAIVLVVEGGGFYQDANGFRDEVTAGDMLILFPELAHNYGPRRQTRWSEIYAVFQGPLFDLLRTGGILHPSRPKVRLPSLATGERQLRAIFATAGEARGGADRAVSHLAAWLTDLLAQDPDSKPTEPGLAQVRALLDANLESELDWNEISRRSGWSYETLRKRFSDVYGISPARYRFERRVEAAKSLLLDTRLANKEIAATLGFADEFHFSKRFKQAVGVSPREFRQGQR